MASISSAGLGSGLDVQGLVDQLVTSEGQPTQERLDRKEVGIQASLSAIGTFKSALGEVKSSLTGLQTASAFQKKSVTVNREGFVSASAGADETFPVDSHGFFLEGAGGLQAREAALYFAQRRFECANGGQAGLYPHFLAVQAFLRRLPFRSHQLVHQALNVKTRAKTGRRNTRHQKTSRSP